QVRRNIGRFPDDFMFELTEDEFENLRCHFGTSSSNSSHEELRRKIEDMEKKYDGQFRIVFEAIKLLIATESRPKKKIGF
ncbi:MAG: ORF6N domain-containing protein, partial [Spirochaetes bacterium]|nr:ORF6N domain-containing protein [Spirochaetota bacterium]